jgi:hypothetical protein
MIFAGDPDMAVNEEDGMLASIEVLEYAKRLAEEHRAHSKAERILSSPLCWTVKWQASL